MAGKVVGSALVIQMADYRANVFNTGTIHLFTVVAGGVITATTTLANFTEAAFGGYAAQTPTWGAPVLNGASTHAPSQGTTVFFSNTSGANQTVAGYYLLDALGNLLAAEVFGAPITIPTAVSLAVTLAIDNLSEF